MTDNEFRDMYDKWLTTLGKAAFEHMPRPLQSWGASPMQYIADAHRTVEAINEFMLGQDSAMEACFDDQS